MKTKLTNLLLFAVVFVSFTNVYAQKVKKNSSVDVSADTPGSTMDAKTAKKYYNVDPKKVFRSEPQKPTNFIFIKISSAFILGLLRSINETFPSLMICIAFM